MVECVAFLTLGSLLLPLAVFGSPGWGLGTNRDARLRAQQFASAEALGGSAYFLIR